MEVDDEEGLEIEEMGVKGAGGSDGADAGASERAEGWAEASAQYSGEANPLEECLVMTCREIFGPAQAHKAYRVLRVSKMK